ncbi:MAG: nucleotidyltransferase domain-containing protein [Candidatus Omnitrophica bacterium]|nr:nucleotidyltransferase domain-containing protein [Candidatus Omnitrophota bacterium]MCM8778144.1 nucleotidyltransferase domain-containing protein [Candidatus Omnitrophota bacterium]
MIKKERIRHSIEDLIDNLKYRLMKERDIVFAYILGSYADGCPGPLSDFDIGIYIEESKEIFEKKLYLNFIITDILKTDEVDIIILNTASPFFIHHSLKNAKLLFSKDERTRFSFLVKNMKEYFDMQYYYVRFKESLLKRIREGRYSV